MVSTCALFLSRLQEERDRQAQLRGPPKIDPDVAATHIQKVSYNNLKIHYCLTVSNSMHAAVERLFSAEDDCFNEARGTGIHWHGKETTLYVSTNTHTLSKCRYLGGAKSL